jgi:hypothetical protein
VIPVMRARFLSGFSGEASSILGFFAPLVCDMLNTEDFFLRDAPKTRTACDEKVAHKTERF